MSDTNTSRTQNDFDLSEDTFLVELGRFLRTMRVAAGFKSIRSFTNTVDISYSQYQGYESGKNLTVASLKKILREFNLSTRDWLNLDVMNAQKADSKFAEEMKQARVRKILVEVKKIDGLEIARKLSDEDVHRYIDILIYCHSSRSSSDIIEKLLKVQNNIYTFKKVAGKLLEYKWLERTDKERISSPKQRYLITEAGKKVVRLGK